MSDSKGERLRVAHALERIDRIVEAIRIALESEEPVGLDGCQALLSTAGTVMAHVAAADAYGRGTTIARVREVEAERDAALRAIAMLRAASEARVREYRRMCAGLTVAEVKP